MKYLSLIVLSFFSANSYSEYESEMNNLYPYLVTSDYPIDEKSGKSVPIGHDIFVEWVLYQNGIVESFDISKENDSERLKITAKENLINTFRSDIKAMKFDGGPNSKPFIILGDHWNTATQILNPELHSWARNALDSDELIVSIPNRETLLIFPFGGKIYQSNIMNFVKEKEATSSNQLTFSLFKLNDEGLIAID